MDKWLLTSKANPEKSKLKENVSSSSSDLIQPSTSTSREIDLESNSDDDDEPTVKKIRKCPKFLESWFEDKNLKTWLKKNTAKNANIHIAFCKICDISLKVSAGKKDLVHHANTLKHKKNVDKLLLQPNILNALQPQNTTTAKQVINAELSLSAFCVEHNIAFSTMDHLVLMLKSVVLDSAIIRQVQSARTKTTAIVKNVIGATQSDNLHHLMRQNKFSLCIDESTDMSTTKLLSLVVRMSHENKVEDYFLKLIKVTKADATNIHNSIVNLFLENNIDYKNNLIGFAADGAPVMNGKNHSVAVLLKNDCKNLFCIKCICHSFALCSSYACKKLPASTETLAREIYCYVQNSPKRIEEFAQIQILLNEKPKKILHPSQTRWLSLESVVKRLLELYEELKIYFAFAVNVDKLENAKIILNYLNDPVNELYLKFLSSILPVVNNLNRLFQSEAPKIHKLYNELKRLVFTILDCFLCPLYLKNNNIEDIDINNSNNYCSLDEIYLGAAVTAQLIEQSNISFEIIKSFKINCLNFYVELAAQIYQRFDFKNPQIKILATISPESVVSKQTRSIVELCSLFPNLINTSDFQLADTEWREIRNFDFNEIFQNENFVNIDVEYFWRKILKQKRGDDRTAFPVLQKFIFNLLSLPVSSANVERTFSAINLNKTKIRNKLDPETLSGILLSKDFLKKGNMLCHNFVPDVEMYKKFNSKMY